MLASISPLTFSAVENLLKSAKLGKCNVNVTSIEVEYDLPHSSIQPVIVFIHPADGPYTVKGVEKSFITRDLAYHFPTASAQLLGF